MDQNQSKPEPIEAIQPVQAEMPSDGSPDSESTDSQANRKIVILGIAVVGLIIVFIAVIFIGIRSQNLQSQPQPEQVTPTEKPPNQSPTPTIEYIEPIEPSALQNYFYSDNGINAIYFTRNDENETQCSFYFIGNKAKYLNKTDYQTVPCETGVSSGTVDLSSYKKWIDNIYFISDVSDVQSGKIAIFDAHRNFLAYEFAYFKDKYTFISVDDSLKYWIFELKVPDEKETVQYEVFDRTKKSLAQFSFERPQEWDVFEVLYDQVNKGYIFILRRFSFNHTEGEDYAHIRIEYFSMETLQKKNLYTGVPYITIGRGCTPSKVISKQKGQILIKADCFQVPQEYLDLDGNIRFILQ